MRQHTDARRADSECRAGAAPRRGRRPRDARALGRRRLPGRPRRRGDPAWRSRDRRLRRLRRDDHRPPYRRRHLAARGLRWSCAAEAGDISSTRIVVEALLREELDGEGASEHDIDLRAAVEGRRSVDEHRVLARHARPSQPRPQPSSTTSERPGPGQGGALRPEADHLSHGAPAPISPPPCCFSRSRRSVPPLAPAGCGKATSGPPPDLTGLRNEPTQ